MHSLVCWIYHTQMSQLVAYNSNTGGFEMFHVMNVGADNYRAVVGQHRGDNWYFLAWQEHLFLIFLDMSLKDKVFKSPFDYHLCWIHLYSTFAHLLLLLQWFSAFPILNHEHQKTIRDIFPLWMFHLDKLHSSYLGW